MKQKLLIAALAIAAVVLPSCSMMDTTDANNVEYGRHYNNFNDADNAILGIYGKLMQLVEPVVVLGELRADLMETAENATFDQVDISNHTENAANKYCNVAPFYEVILNCNDALANFDKMRAESKLSNDEYSYRYADVMTVRCWVYLQLAVHFGNIPYVTDPLFTVDDLSNPANFAVKSFDEVLAELAQCMESLTVKGLSINSPLYRERNVDGNDMQLVLLNKNFVRGDIHLWSGNYQRAAECYYDVIDDGETYLGLDRNVCYKVDGYVWDNSNEPRFQVTYRRYKETDASSYRNKWKEIFALPQGSAELRREGINVLHYDARFIPQYPLIELFANTGAGKYRLKPTDRIITLWEAQIQREGIRFDGRGRQASFDYPTGGNANPVILKYLYDYYKGGTTFTVDANNTIELQYNRPELTLRGRWFIYRAGLLHLRYAEAVNRAGYPDLAYAVINGGISGAYDWPMTNGSRRNDKTGVQYSGYPPAHDDTVSVKYKYPYFLDARFNAANTTFEQHRQPWRENYGVRGRAFLRSIPTDTVSAWSFTPAQIPVDENHAAVRWLEEHILTEAAMECAFEGHRWGDMLRIALRKKKYGEEGMLFLNQTLNKAKPNATTVTEANLFLPIGKKTYY